MKDKKIQIVRLRLNPERNVWDRKILAWLETIPLGYRAKAMKEALVKIISVQDPFTQKASPPMQGADRLNLQLDTLFKNMEPHEDR